MERRFKKTRRLVASAAVGLVVLIAGALVALQTDAGKAFVLDALTGRINQKLAGEVEAQRISGPLLWGATLHGVEVRDARGEDILQVDEVEVTYALATLLGGDLVLGLVELDEPELFIHRYEDGTLNLSTLAKPSDETPSEDVDLLTIHRFVVAGGTIHYEDQQIDRVETSGHLRVPGRGSIEGEIEALSFSAKTQALARAVQVQAKGIDIERVPERLDLTAARVVVDKQSHLEDLRLTYTPGDDTGAGPIAGSFKELVVAPELAKLASPTLELTSPITLRATFEGIPKALAVTGVASAKRGGEVEFDGAIDVPGATGEFDVQADNFEASAWVATDGPSMRLDAKGTIAGRRDKQGAIQADLRMDASSVEFGDYRVDKLTLGDKKRFALTLGAPGDDGKRPISGQGDVEAAGVGGKDLALGGLDARVEFDTKRFSPGVPITYDVAGSASAVKYGDHASKRAEFDLSGTLVRAPRGADAAIARLVARGTADVRDYQGKSLRVGRLDTRIDVEQTPASVTGDIRADLDQLVSGERTYGSGSVTLDLEKGGKFGLSVRAVPKIAPQFPVSLRTAGEHGEEFDVFDLSEFVVGRPGMTWKIRDDALVRVTDESVIIDSLVLFGPTQPIRLDGTYPLEGAVAAIIERLGRAGLEELLRGENLPERLREQIPKDLEGLAPEELEKALPDEVEDRLSDEIRKRLPKF